MSASGSPENNLTVLPLLGKSLIEQKKASTTTLPERTADILPPFIETCLVKESCVGDTESLLDIEDGYCCFRVAPSVPVWDEVHKGNPCVGIVDKAAFRKGEAAIMIARKADNTEGFVSFHRYVDNLLQCPTVRRTRLRDREVL